MGYQVRVHLCVFTVFPDHGFEIARFDLDGIRGTALWECIERHRRQGKFGKIFADDGDALIEVDRYNQKLVVASAREVEQAINEDRLCESDRRYFRPLQVMLTEFIRYHGDEAQCVFFGH